MGIEALDDEARKIAETATDPRPELLLGHVDWLTAALPTAVVTVLPGSHLPHLEHPDELALLLSQN